MHYCWMIDEGYPDWGGDPCYWFEINADGYAEREMQVYPNGNVLSYDRIHHLDDYGGLFQMEIGEDSLEDTTPCTAEEFETLWQTHIPINRSLNR